MNVIQRIAFYQHRRDEQPNQELARDLAAAQDEDGIREIAGNLWNNNQNICSDCLKVLYETGYLQPSLIAPYLDDFLKLLASKNNRMVWGGMIAIAAVAAIKPDEVFAHRKEIQCATDRGSTITVDNGIQALATLAASKEEYADALFPYLLNHQAACHPPDFPRTAEKIAPAVKARQRDLFMSVLRDRLPELAGARADRVKKLMGSIEKQ